MGYGNHHSRGVGCDDKAMGGAAQGLGIEALTGDGDMFTVFDDFNSTLKGAEGFGDAAIWEDSGWVLTDVGVPTNDAVSMNSPSTVAIWEPSCLSIYSGDADDAGGNMQLDLVNGAIGTLVGTANFPHIFIPETDAGAAALDGTVFMFACRVGVRADLTTTDSGDWDSKFFIGWAEAGDTGILTAGTGLIAQAETGPLVGFHALEDGSLRGISQRTVNTAYAAGTNYVELLAAGGLDGTTANGANTAGDTMWFDLALRMNITDQSDDAANGWTEFFYRRVPRSTVRPGSLTIGPNGLGGWTKHPTVLLNQTPNNDVALVPTIEMVNGPTANRDGKILLDWWCFGHSRLSRLSR